MTYVIAKIANREDTFVHADTRKEAQEAVGSITSALSELFNPEFITISKKEDDTLLHFNGQLIGTIEVREDDEVDVSIINE